MKEFRIWAWSDAVPSHSPRLGALCFRLPLSQPCWAGALQQQALLRTPQWRGSPAETQHNKSLFSHCQSPCHEGHVTSDTATTATNSISPVRQRSSDVISQAPIMQVACSHFWQISLLGTWYGGAQKYLLNAALLQHFLEVRLGVEGSVFQVHLLGLRHKDGAAQACASMIRNKSRCFPLWLSMG